MRRIAASLPLLALALAAPVRAEDAPRMKRIPNPEYASWSKFAVGAFVELTSTSESMGIKQSNTMTHKLVELTADKAVVETAIQLAGLPPEHAPAPTRREVTKEIEVPDVPAPADAPRPSVKEGEETIDVAGTSIKCKTFESTTEAAGMKTTAKTWTTDAVPGGMARSETRTEGTMGDQPFVSTTTTVVTKWSAK